MGIQGWTFLFVGITFTLYLYIAIKSRVSDTEGFYVAGHGVSAFANGMATAADWMSAASFISMAGLISFMGSDGMIYLLGWTGGYVLLALLLAPFLRKFGQYTVPDFVATRYYSNTARLVAAIAAIFISFTYVAGQMRGVGVVFSRFLGNFLQPAAEALNGMPGLAWVEVVDLGVIIGMAIVLFYAILGGMKGITYTQVAQYCVLIFAFSVPAIAIAWTLFGNPIPQVALGEAIPLLDGLHEEFLGNKYTNPFSGTWSMLNVFCVTLALMVGTAGLPHVIVRFYTLKKVADARWSAGWALLFIALLYTTAPALAAFSKYNILASFQSLGADGMANLDWVKNWVETGLIDKSGWTASMGAKDLLGTIDRDIIVLATPEIAGLPPWVIGLTAAGGLAAALSTASGLLLVISSALAHDVYGKMINPEASDKKRLAVGRWMIVVAVIIAGFLGIRPPGFVAEVVAFAFGLAAASFFPIIVLGIFWKRCTREGAIAGMSIGLAFTMIMILLMRSTKIFGTAEPMMDSFFGINAQGVGTVGMVLNFVICYVVSINTPAPPQEVQDMIDEIRYPGSRVD